MKRDRIAAVVLASIIAVSQPLTTFWAAAEPKQISVKADGLLQQTDFLPINVSGSTMVEAETLFRILGVTRYTLTEETGRITFYYQNKVVDMTVGSKVATVTGNEMGLSVAPVTVDGRIYLPLRYVAERCATKVGWAAETNTVTLDTAAADYSVIESIQRSEGTENMVTYTLADAVGKVVAESNDIATYDKAIVDAEETLDEDDLERTFENMKGKILDDPYAFRELDRTVNALHNTIDQNKIKKEQFVETTESNIIKQAIAIEDAEYDIMLLEKTIELAELEIKNMEIKESLGYETPTNVKTKKDSLAQSKISLTALKTNLKNTKMELNNIMDIEYDKEIVIQYNQDATALQIANLDSYIEEKIAGSHNIQLLEIALRYQGTVRRTHYDLPQGIREEASPDGTGAAEKTATIEANYKTAESNLQAAKDTMDLSLRTAYNQLQSLEETYTSQKIELGKAIDTYKKVSINYETGGAVIYDVLTAEMNLLNTEAALKQNRLSYASARYSFENPA